MIIRLPFQVVEESGVKTPRKNVKVDIRLSLTPGKHSKRVERVIETFNIGLGDKEMVLYDCEIDIQPGSVIFISGESGGGKTLLLNYLKSNLKYDPEFAPIISEEDIYIDINEVVVDGVGRDMNEAMKLLTYVGLSEAFILIRKYKELSVGQKYRYKLAKILSKHPKTVILDDFTAVLDRVTARVIAYLIQKIARRMNITLIIASTHEDIVEDLKPDLWIRKPFGPYIEFPQYDRYEGCSIAREVEISRGTWEDYKKLEFFHYRQRHRLPAYIIYKMTYRERLIGVIVYVTTFSRLTIRKFLFPEWEGKPRLINKYISRIARVVIHPTFRGIGLGAKLVRDTMPLVGRPYIETLAVMAKYNPFFERAGMTYIGVNKSKIYKRNRKILESMGLDINRRFDINYVREWLKNQDIEEVRRVIEKKLLEHHFFRPRHNTVEDLIFILQNLNLTPPLLLPMEKPGLQRSSRPGGVG